MSDRALIARERGTGYDLFRVRDLGFLPDSSLFDPSFPVRTGGDTVPPIETDVASTRGIDGDLVVGGASPGRIAAEIDPILDEALFVVSETGVVQGYCIVAIAVDPTAVDRDVPGLLARAVDDEVAPLRYRVQGARAALLSLATRPADCDPALREAFERAVADWAVRTVRIRALGDEGL